MKCLSVMIRKYSKDIEVFYEKRWKYVRCLNYFILLTERRNGDNYGN